VILFKFATEIKGLSKVTGHEGWLNADSMAFGVGRSIPQPTGGKSKREPSPPSVSEVTFSRAADQASPELFAQACGGESLGTCTIHLIQVSGSETRVYLTILLEEAMVSSFSASSGGDNPMESVSVNFTKVSVQYDTFDGKKVVTGTPKKWDLAVNKPY
jgi:type VI secretion system secreted protein Hcp